MSEAPDIDQKTEAPTQKRRDEAQRDGDVLQSKELGTALVMLCGAGWLMAAGPWFVQSCMEMLRDGLTLNQDHLIHFSPATQIYRFLAAVLAPVGSLFLLALMGSVAGPVVLGSAGFRVGAISFKASRINPVSGFARIFGAQGLVELGKALLKALVLSVLGAFLVRRDLSLIIGLSAGDLRSAVTSLGGSLTHILIWLSIGLAVIALIDVPIQLFRRNGRLRMSPQQVKEELRQSEGSPELKQAVRQKQYAMLNSSARKAVSEATVILTNPTHFAVALRYVPGKDFAPIVVARGRGETAQAIKALAKGAAVPTLEYPRLARAIYFTARAGQPVAEDLFIAVATILAFVFNIERALAEGVAQPEVIVPQNKSFDENGAVDAT
jgi:flagellar biosynthesis protein FlhB